MHQTKANRNYRASFILDTRESDLPVESQIERLTETLHSIGGEVSSVENLGRKEFVRITDKNHPGDLYVQIFFSGPGGAVRELRDKVRLDKTVKRIFVESLK